VEKVWGGGVVVWASTFAKGRTSRPRIRARTGFQCFLILMSPFFLLEFSVQAKIRCTLTSLDLASGEGTHLVSAHNIKRKNQETIKNGTNLG